MRHLIIALLGGLALAIGAYKATLAVTPFALMTAASNRIAPSGRVNVMSHGPLVTAKNQPIVRPSPDLAYSNCVFDLSGGPVLIDVQPVPNRYWSVSISDARTDVAAVRSDRDTGGKAARLALYRDGQRVPAGYEPVRLGHDKGIALIRILLANPQDFAAVDVIRRQSSCTAI